MNFDTFTPEILIQQCLTFEMDVLTSWKFIAVQFYVPSILRPTKIESKNLNDYFKDPLLLNSRTSLVFMLNQTL